MQKEIILQQFLKIILALLVFIVMLLFGKQNTEGLINERLSCDTNHVPIGVIQQKT